MTEAVEALTRAVSLDPTSWNAQYNLGVALYMQARFSDAIKAYHLALELQPDNSEIQTALAKTYLKSGQTDAALAQYQLVRKSHPFDPEIRYEIGLIFRQRKQCREADYSFQQTGLSESRVFPD